MRIAVSRRRGYAGITDRRNILHTQVASADFLGLSPHSPLIFGFFGYPVSKAGGAVAFA
jgi:hypothetical protein